MGGAHDAIQVELAEMLPAGTLCVAFVRHADEHKTAFADRAMHVSDYYMSVLGIEVPDHVANVHEVKLLFGERPRRGDVSDDLGAGPDGEVDRGGPIYGAHL